MSPTFNSTAGAWAITLLVTRLSAAPAATLSHDFIRMS
jgi:hypothetical protein